jgi:hypothetical protein
MVILYSTICSLAFDAEKKLFLTACFKKRKKLVDNKVGGLVLP